MTLHAVPTIRPLSGADAPEIQRLADDPLIGEMTRIPYPYPPDGAVSFLRDALTRIREEREYNYAILDGQSFAGLCGLRRTPDQRDRAELGYWLGRDFRGRGIATHAVRLLLGIGFRQYGLGLIHARVLERNPASGRVLVKNRFEEIERRRNIGPEHRPDDILITYHITRATWELSEENRLIVD